MKLIYAPNSYFSGEHLIMFLAGSIEMGKAVNWQNMVAKSLEGLDVTVLNPRRLDWDSNWTQDPEAGPFRTQVDWELDGIFNSKIIFMNFDPNTKSPITLLELGLVLNAWWEPDVIVCCPKAYFRYGNVAITCERHGVTVYEKIDNAIETLKVCIERHQPLL